MKSRNPGWTFARDRQPVDLRGWIAGARRRSRRGRRIISGFTQPPITFSYAAKAMADGMD